MPKLNEDDNQKLFNSLANDCGKDGPMKTLHDLTGQTQIFEKSGVKKRYCNDIGCGGGILWSL